MIEIFSKQQFEDSLPNTNKFKWTYEGFNQNEHCYSIWADPNNKSKVFIRSSVGINGLAAETGQDSIRILLVDKDNNFLGSKISKYITRVKGWEHRMIKNIKDLIILRSKAGDHNGAPIPIIKCKKEGPNKGRFFVKVPEFKWIT